MWRIHTNKNKNISWHGRVPGAEAGVWLKIILAIFQVSFSHLSRIQNSEIQIYKNYIAVYRSLSLSLPLCVSEVHTHTDTLAALQAYFLWQWGNRLLLQYGQDKLKM